MAFESTYLKVTVAFCVTLIGCGGGGSSTPASPSDAPSATAAAPPSDPPPSNSGSGGNGAVPPTSSPAPKPPAHHRCGWMNDNVALGIASFVANADDFDAIHPNWWALGAAGTVTATSWADDSTVITTAHGHSVELMPLVYGGDDVSLIRAVISSPASIQSHVQTLVQLAVSHQYDGLEIDYEHLWSAGDRAGYTAFITQLARALHAQHKELSLAVPAIAVDDGNNGYDYAALVAAGADVIHLMGYDFHFMGGDHLGPLAPIGWIDAVTSRVDSLGISGSFILGIANYGIGSGWYANSADAIKLCGGSYPTTTTHMASCPYGDYDAGIAPHCTTAKGDIWFEDAASIAQKAATARAHHLRGVAYYTLGGEPAGVLDALKAAYP